MMFVSFFLFMTGVWGYSQSAAGLAVTPGPLTVIPVAVLAGRLAARMGHRPLLVSGGVLYTVNRRSPTTCKEQSLVLASDKRSPGVSDDLVAGPADERRSRGTLLPSLAGAAVFGLPPARFGIGSAVNNAVRQLGSAIGVALAVAIASERGTVPAVSAFGSIYLILAALGVLTAVVSLAIDTRPHA
jgi:hypothetical protein